MNKTEPLFKMLEHPELYAEEQWREILADEECRQLYVLMAKTQSAFKAEHATEQITDDMIENEWQQIAAKRQSRTIIAPMWRKIAAAAAIVVAFFGITFAAVQTGFFGLRNTQDQAVSTTTNSYSAAQTTGGEASANTVPTDTVAEVQPHLYDDSPLEQILADLASYYHVDVTYEQESVRSLRLFYQWEPSYSLEKVVDMLNHFEAFNIRLEGGRLVVEQANAQEDK